MSKPPQNSGSDRPEAADALTRFRQKGGAVSLISNAPRPGDQVQKMLDHMGVPRASYDGIVTSGDVARDPGHGLPVDAAGEARVGRPVRHGEVRVLQLESPDERLERWAARGVDGRQRHERPDERPLDRHEAEPRRGAGHPAEDLPLGVDDMPLPLHTAGSGNKRTHEIPFGLR